MAEAGRNLTEIKKKVTAHALTQQDQWRDLEAALQRTAIYSPKNVIVAVL